MGKFKADILNMGTNAIRSIGDSFVNASDRARVQKYMEESWGYAGGSLVESLKTLIYDIGAYIFSILVQEGKLNQVDFLTGGNIISEERIEDKIQARAENIYKGSYPQTV